MPLQPLAPIRTAHLFGPLHRELMALLRGMTADDWQRPTVAGNWRARDVAAHLLDVDLRYLSVTRDGHVLPPNRELAGYRDVVGWINHLNATAVETSRRFSTRVIMDLLDVTGVWVAEMVESLPPDGPAVFGVAWAGEMTSVNWMDTGREYTERWHHQAQLRDALGMPGLLGRHWLEPLLNMSVRVLPVAFDAVQAPAGTQATLSVELPAPDADVLAWTVRREAGGWIVSEGTVEAPDAHVCLAADDAWRLFYNALDADSTRARGRVTGDATLVAPLLAARSVMV